MARTGLVIARGDRIRAELASMTPVERKEIGSYIHYLNMLEAKRTSTPAPKTATETATIAQSIGRTVRSAAPRRRTKKVARRVNGTAAAVLAPSQAE